MRNLTTLLLSVTTTAVLALPGTANSQGPGAGNVKTSFSDVAPGRQARPAPEAQNECAENPGLPDCSQYPVGCWMTAVLKYSSSSSGEKVPHCPDETSPVAASKSDSDSKECQYRALPLKEMTPIRIGEFVINGFVESKTKSPYYEVFKYNPIGYPHKVPEVSELNALESQLISRGPLATGPVGVYFVTPAINMSSPEAAWLGGSDDYAHWRKQLRFTILCR